MDKKLKIRKTVLLSLIAVLALIYALQLAFSNKTSRKVFELSQSPDFIQIEKDDSKITLVLEGGLWYMGEEKENVKDSSMEDILENLSAITTIETVSRNASQADYEKYGFQDIDSITVTAKSSGKTVRELKIGKQGASSTTNYILLDGKNDILLAAGDLSYKFSLTKEDLKPESKTEGESDNSENPQEEKPSE